MLPPLPQARPPSAYSGPLRAYFGGFARRPSNVDTHRYMRGDCGHFALALARLLPGSRLWQVGVGHFAVEDAQGQFWDVRGKMTLEQLWQGLAGPQMLPMDRQEVIAELDSGAYRCDRHVPHREAVARKLLAGWLVPAPEPPRSPRRPAP